MREPPSIPNTESEHSTTELEMTSAYSGQVTDVKYTTTTTDLFLQDWNRRSFRAGKQKHPLSPPIGTEKTERDLVSSVSHCGFVTTGTSSSSPTNKTFIEHYTLPNKYEY